MINKIGVAVPVLIVIAGIIAGIIAVANGEPYVNYFH